jgi:hypothetical protein
MQITSLILASSHVLAALPPMAQSAREIRAILDDPHMHEQLGSAERIHEIVRNESGYLVKTDHYTLQVDVIYGGTERRIGPIQFRLEFHDAQRQ